MKRALLFLCVLPTCIDRDATLAEFCRVNHAADCPDAGTGGGSTGGGSTGGGSGGGTAGGSAGGSAGGTAGGSAGGNAGGSAGGTAGGSAGGGTGGGSPGCSGSSSPRLQCTVVRLQDGGLPGEAWMASNSSGFLAAWSETLQHRLELRQISAGGAVSSLLSEPAAGAPRDVVVAGAGTQWAVVWRDGAGQPTHCASSVDSGTVTLDAGTGTPARQGVAVSPSGGVAAIAVPGGGLSYAIHGESPSGCPREYDQRFSGLAPPRGVSALYRPQSDEFLYVVTGRGPSMTDPGGLYLFRPDGGNRQYYGLESFTDHSSAISDDGVFVLAATASTLTPDFSLRALRADLSTSIPAMPQATLPANTGWWNSSPCGPGCFALTWVEQLSGSEARVKVHLVSTPQLVAHAGSPYDVVCSLPPASVAVGVAYFGGKLGVTVSSGTTVELYVCDLPP